MNINLIMREDGSADVIVNGNGGSVDGTLAISCLNQDDALKIQQTLYDTLRDFIPTQALPISAVG